MSTHAGIVAKTETGWAGIYCHFDGGIDAAGETLFEYYRDAEKVAALIALGSISSLEEELEPMIQDKEIRIKEGQHTPAVEAETVQEVMEDAEFDEVDYWYVFDGSKWYYENRFLLAAEVFNIPESRR